MTSLDDEIARIDAEVARLEAKKRLDLKKKQLAKLRDEVEPSVLRKIWKATGPKRR